MSSPGRLSRRDFAVAAAGAALGGSVVAGAFWAASFLRESNPQSQFDDESGFWLSAPKCPDNLIQNWIKCWLRRTSSKLRDKFTGIEEDSMTKSRILETSHCVAGDGLRTQTHILYSSAKASSVGDSADRCSGAEGCADILCDSVNPPEEDTLKLNGCARPVTTSLSNGNVKADVLNPAKRNGYLSWDDYFMAIAFLSAQRSKDPNRQVGACIVSQDQVILGIGYNGFPRGCSDDKLPWSKVSTDGDPLKTKYPYVCHAEVNAILNRNHASAAGQRLYVTMFPCNECAKVIIQARIAEVAYFTDKGQGQRKDKQESSFIASRKLLAMAGVKVWQYKPLKQALLLEYR